MIDEKVLKHFNISDIEYNDVVNRFVDNNKIKLFPTKSRKQLIIYIFVSTFFENNKEYSEREVNEIIRDLYEYDFVSIRRSLINYQLLIRSKDGAIYKKNNILDC